MQARKDFGSSADSFFDSLNESLAPLAHGLRALIRKVLPEATESIKWGMPVYETEKLVCAIRPAANHVALQFYSGATDFWDPEGLLEGTGKRMRHVKIRCRADIRSDMFAAWLKQAAS